MPEDSAESDSCDHAEPAGEAGPEPGLQIGDPAGALGDAAWAWLRRTGAAALGVVARTGEVRVRVVRDEEMARVHGRWLGDPTTTDVLTFDLGSDPKAGLVDADLYVCADEAARQAEARGHGIEAELLLYVVHGVLHCLGYDDADPAAARAMHEREDEILQAIGVGALYGDGAAGRAHVARKEAG